MEIRTEIVRGKRRIIIIESSSGVDKTKEAVLKVMGKDWEYKNESDSKKVV